MLRVVVNALAQRICVLKGSQRPIDPADHFAQRDFRWRTPQLIAAVCTPQTADKSSALEVPKNGLQKFLRETFFRSDVPNLDDAGWMLGEHGECLQGVKSFLGDAHGVVSIFPSNPLKSTYLADIVKRKSAKTSPVEEAEGARASERESHGQNIFVIVSMKLCSCYLDSGTNSEPQSAPQGKLSQHESGRYKRYFFPSFGPFEK